MSNLFEFLVSYVGSARLAYVKELHKYTSPSFTQRAAAKILRVFYGERLRYKHLFEDRDESVERLKNLRAREKEDAYNRIRQMALALDAANPVSDVLTSKKRSRIR